MIPEREQRFTYHQTDIPSRSSFENSLLLAEGLEMHMESPFPLRDRIKVMPGTWYGADYFHAYEQKFAESVIDNPEKTHIFTAIGEPGTGKTTILDEVLTYQLSMGSELADFARSEGYRFRVTNLPWGDVFSHIAHDKRVTGIQYHNDSDFFAAKLREIEEANTIYRNIFFEILERPKIPGEIEIISADMPAITGMVTPDGETIGIPRCFELLRMLGGERGSFERFEGQYTLYAIGIIAAKEVRDLSKAGRAIMLAYENPEELQRIMADQGLEFAVSKPDQITDYVAEFAPPMEMELLERDIYHFICDLQERGFGFQDSYQRLGRINLHSLRTFSDFSENDRDRVTGIGQGLLPWLMDEQYNINTNESVILLNDEVLDNTMMYLDIAKDRPLLRGS